MGRHFIAAVIGHPVAHSISPRIFDLLCRLTRKRVHYFSLDVSPGSLAVALDSMRRAGFTGLNVTLPHKEAAVKYLDALSPEARAIEAVNVIQFIGNRSIGHNTDAPAFLDALKEKQVLLKNQSAAVFGAGGAAKAVCHGLSQSGVRKIWIINRNFRRAQSLAMRLKTRFPATEFLASHAAGNIRGRDMEAAIWVNATPLGMEGSPSGILLPRACGGCTACDLVYGKSETLFLKAARRKGMKTISGLGMLVYQALRTWEIWFGDLLKKKKLKQQIEKQLLL